MKKYRGEKKEKIPCLKSLKINTSLKIILYTNNKHQHVIYRACEYPKNFQLSLKDQVSYM